MRVETNMARSAEGGSGDTFERERRALHGLLEPLNDVPNLTWPEQWATAFVIEDIKRSEPTAWEHVVQVLRDELRTAHAQEGISGITWRMAREIQDRYSAFLAKCLQEEQDAVRRGNLEILQQGIQRDFSTRHDAHEAGRRVPMGSVIFEHVPPWFPQTE